MTSHSTWKILPYIKNGTKIGFRFFVFHIYSMHSFFLKPMKKNTILENVFIEKLIFGWQGLATAEDGRKIIITGWAIPKSTVTLRILKVHKNRLEAQIVAVTKKSPYERELPSHWQIYGGCKWLAIPYEIQAEIKENQVKEAFYALKEKTEWTTFPPSYHHPWRKDIETRWNFHGENIFQQRKIFTMNFVFDSMHQDNLIELSTVHIASLQMKRWMQYLNTWMNILVYQDWQRMTQRQEKVFGGIS